MKARCPFCYNEFALTPKGGAFRKHLPSLRGEGDPCPSSGRTPSEAEALYAARQSYLRAKEEAERAERAVEHLKKQHLREEEEAADRLAKAKRYLAEARREFSSLGGTVEFP